MFMTEREQFIGIINTISDERLKKAALEMTTDLPDYFWHIPASSSGKYHPECDLGEGGLLRHSIMVCTIALDLLTSEVFIKDNPVNRDLVIISTLFHDGFKSGEVINGQYSDHTVFEHPLISADFVRKHLKQNGVDESIISIITLAIQAHMGKWNTSKYSELVLRTPQNNFEKLIHTADYVASRKYVKWKGE